MGLCSPTYNVWGHRIVIPESVSQGSRRIESGWRRNMRGSWWLDFFYSLHYHESFCWQECRKSRESSRIFSNLRNLQIWHIFSIYFPYIFPYMFPLFSSWPSFFRRSHGAHPIPSQDEEWKACRCRSEMPSKVPPGTCCR